MKGKIFVLFIMVGIPTITWAFLAWVVMLALGALHSVSMHLQVRGAP